VQFLSQINRTMPTAASVLRAIDATSNKPETGGTVSSQVLTLKQVATVQSAVPNILLEQPALETMSATDLRLAYNEGLGQAGTGLDGGLRLPGALHGQHPRLGPEGDDDDPGRRLQPGRADRDSGDRRIDPFGPVTLAGRIRGDVVSEGNGL
jgi:hypothetical protein